MRFTGLHMTDFRGTRELAIDFEPDVTVIVGRNGSGKTSILDALAMMVGVIRYAPGDLPQNSSGLYPVPSDIRHGAQSSMLQATYGLEDQSSGMPETKTLEITIGGDARQSAKARVSGKPAPSQPRVVYSRQERGFGLELDGNHDPSAEDLFDPEALQDRSLQKDLRAIGDLTAWWDRRDAQEARRVRDGEHDYRDPQLEAIRNLVIRIDSFSGVTFDSTALPPGLHFIKSNRTPVHVSGLSGGERSYIILLADLARQLQVFAPGKPLDEIPAIVLIDEIELNLHPGWQSEIVPTLTEVFRACQFIVTTHSPQVLSSVDNTKVRVIEQEVRDRSWKVTVPLSTRGRTSNYLLEGVLGARERFPPIDTLIGDFNAAIDQQDEAAATEALERIEQEIGDDAPTLLVLRKRLKKLRSTA